MQRLQLVPLKVFRCDMFFISCMTRIRFKNRYIAGILLFTNRIHCQYARLVTQGYFAHFGRIVYVLVEILRINLYFRQPYDTIGRHWLFGTHTWQLIQIQIFADALSCSTGSICCCFDCEQLRGVKRNV